MTKRLPKSSQDSQGQRFLRVLVGSLWPCLAWNLVLGFLHFHLRTIHVRADSALGMRTYFHLSWRHTQLWFCLKCIFSTLFTNTWLNRHIFQSYILSHIEKVFEMALCGSVPSGFICLTLWDNTIPTWSCASCLCGQGQFGLKYGAHGEIYGLIFWH